MRYLLLLLTSVGLMMSCGTDSRSSTTDDSTTSTTNKTAIPDERQSPKATPVANYVKKGK